MFEDGILSSIIIKKDVGSEVRERERERGPVTGLVSGAKQRHVPWLLALLAGRQGGTKKLLTLAS